MKKIIMVLAVVLCVSAFPRTGAMAAGFDAKKYVVDEGLLFMVDGDSRKQVDGAEVVEEQTEAGRIYWLAADPDAGDDYEKMYKGWKGGVYFFGDDGKFISFLETPDAPMSYVRFSPDGRRFVLDRGTYVVRDYILYTFDGLAPEKTFLGMGELKWIDSDRFAFAIIDEEKGPRAENADIRGWLSVVVYDAAADLLTTAAEATETEDYTLYEVDAENEELTVTKYSVKDEKDWVDEDKRIIDEITIPIPAAG